MRGGAGRLQGGNKKKWLAKEKANTHQHHTTQTSHCCLPQEQPFGVPSGGEKGLCFVVWGRDLGGGGAPPAKHLLSSGHKMRVTERKCGAEFMPLQWGGGVQIRLGEAAHLAPPQHGKSLARRREGVLRRGRVKLRIIAPQSRPFPHPKLFNIPGTRFA